MLPPSFYSHAKELLILATAVTATIIRLSDTEEHDPSQPNVEDPVARSTRRFTGKALLMAGRSVSLSSWFSPELAKSIATTWITWGLRMLQDNWQPQPESV